MNIKTGLLLILLFVALNFLKAQVITFEKTFGGNSTDYGHSMQQTTDGGYIVTGWTNNFGAGSYDVYLIRTTSYGDTIWKKTFGGTSGDHGYSVKQTYDGGYIITGQTMSFGAGNKDVYLIKTDANGDSLWTKTFGGINDDYGKSVLQTVDGGYIIVGMTDNFGAGSYDVYVIRTNANGDSIWTKTFGGISVDVGNEIQQTSDGGFIIVGKTEPFTNYMDVYLIKTDVDGDSIWTKTYGGMNNDEGYSVHQTAGGGYIIAGNTGSFGSGGADVYLINTTSIGDIIWTKTYGGTNDDYGKSVKQTTDGGYIIAGITQSFGAGGEDVYLINTLPNGDTAWTKTFGGNNVDGCYSISHTNDGGYAILGYTGSFGAGGYDIYLIKTDEKGNVFPTGIQPAVNCQQSNITSFPNPFSESFKINYFLSENSSVSLKLFDITGKLILIIANEKQTKGEHNINYNGENLKDGIYYYQFVTDEGSEVRKVVKQ